MGNCCSGNTENLSTDQQTGNFEGTKNTNPSKKQMVTNIEIPKKHVVYKTCMVPAYTSTKARNISYDNLQCLIKDAEDTKHYLDIYRR